MNKFYFKSLSILTIFLLSFTTAHSQCVVCIESPSLITCGESADLIGDGYITSVYSDDFNSWTNATTPNPSLWAMLSTGGTTNSNCTGSPTTTSSCAGASSGGDFLWFPQGSALAREIRTIQIPVPLGGTIFFEFKMEGQGGSCDGPDQTNEGIMIQYKTGGIWQDMGAPQVPFSSNPPPYNNEAYFIPPGNGNPLSPQYNTWAQYSIPIPAAAWSANTQFRWIQTSPTSASWDFWGIENVNIVPTGPGGANFLWSAGGQTTQNITVSPITLTNYTLTYSDGVSTCSTTVAVDVSPPVVTPAIVPNPLNPCPSATDLTADVNFNTCNYNVYMFDNGGDGWVTIPQTSSSIDSRIEVFVDGISQGTYTLNNGYGPSVYSFPVTNGGTMSVNFLSGGPNPAECVYVVEDPNGNYVNAQGITTSPNIPVWPPPLPMPNGAFGVNPLNVAPFPTTCPTTNPYNYSWSIIPGGSTAGIGNPNSQNTTVTTAVTQDYLVTVTDANNPGCVADSFITVTGSGGSWDFSTITPNPACQGDCIDLNFTSTVSSGNYNIIIEMIDANGSSSSMFTIDNNGINIATGNPINLCPTISVAIPNVTFNITSLVDAADPNNCEIPITNASQVVSFNTLPNAGNTPLTPTTFCTVDAITDLSTFLSNSPDANGTWTYTGTGIPPVNLPFVGLNYNFDPANYPAGDYTYTVSNSPCPTDLSTITINLETPPEAGQLPPFTTNMCMGSILDLNSLFIVNPVPNTPVWTDVTSGIPGTSVSSNFNPITSGTYTLRNTIVATANCPSDFVETTVIVNDLPTVTFSTINQICLGESLDLNFVVTGSAPFFMTVTDNINPAFFVISDQNGNDNITGNPITFSPNTTGITNLTITNISDLFCSATVSGQNSVVNVLTPPNSGVLTLPLSVCSDDLTIYDLANQISGQDLNGYWLDENNFQQPPSSSFNFNTSMSGGNYTYVVESAACPDAQTIVPVTVITAPNVGTANPQSICINNYGLGNLFDLDNLLNGSPNLGTWYENGIPVPSNINPNTYGVGTTTFTYQVNGISPCSNQSISVDLTINPEPVVSSFTSSGPSTTQGYQIGLDVTMLVGTAPFTIDIFDDEVPFNTASIFIAAGMSGSVNMTPNVIPTTTYAISLITDGNGCTTTFGSIVPVGVIPYPIIDPFTTLTPEICEGDVSSIQFDMTQGVVPVTVDYTINGIPYTEILVSTGVTSVIIPNANLNFGINTFSIVSIIDVNNEAAPNIPNDIQIIYNPNPSATFTTTTPIICFKEDAILEFDFLSGTAPFTVNYNDNLIIQIPSLIFNNLGTTSKILTPNPTVGNHSYSIINIIDAEGCTANIAATSNILVRALPDLDLTINGANPICFGQNSELSFPVLSGLAPFNLNLLEGSTNNTLTVDASGLIGGSTYLVSPPNTTTYTLTSVTDANGCMQTLIDSKTLIVNELPIVDATGTTEICNEEITQIYFDFSAGLSPWTLSYDVSGTIAAPFLLSNTSDSVSVSPSTTSVYTYTTVTDANNCVNNFTDAVTITVNQLPEVIVSGGGEICDDGSTVEVIFNTSNGTPTFNFEYTIGITEKIVSNVGYQHIITTNESGIYTVTNIVDSKGCNGKNINGTANVIVNPVPVADFTAYPQPADVTNPVIHFIDQSTNHTLGIWDFDDNSNLTSTNFGELTHRFSDVDSGTYFVELYVESNKGCFSMQIQEIVIDNAFIFYIPNAFTPNKDQVNDIFKPYVDGVSEYDFYIYSRQGQEIFHTTDITEGWDGYVDGSDEYAISGKYAYAIYIIDLHGKERVFQGNFLLIR